MGRVIPLRRRRRQRPAGAVPDRWKVLQIVPARAGWVVHGLGYDDFSGPEPVVTTWGAALPAWGLVEWIWGTPLEGMPRAEYHWEALVVDSFGKLEPTTALVESRYVITLEIRGPRERPPDWIGGSAEAERARQGELAAWLPWRPEASDD
jgi:hypothetical protein